MTVIKAYSSIILLQSYFNPYESNIGHVRGKTKKGSYILIIDLPAKQSIKVGALGEIQFDAGGYAYVGSAMGGLKSRLLHYVRGPGKPHWHIDYLLQVAALSGVITCENKVRTECRIAQMLMDRFEYVPGFGCSDCQCQSHLFYAITRRKLKSGIMKLSEGLICL